MESAMLLAGSWVNTLHYRLAGFIPDANSQGKHFLKNE
jgi:hypothetical protein